MRREIKLIILVFVLVVGPAVAVSFLAARVLGSWQIVLQKRMETEAVHVLDQVIEAWEKEKSSIGTGIVNEAGERYAASRIATQIQAHPWVDGVYLLDTEAGLLYPTLERHELPEFGSDGESGGQGNFPVILPVGVSDCRRLLDQPALAPSVRAAILLRLAGAAMASGETNQALETLQQVVRLNPAAPPRDPGEGFYYDLIALKLISEARAAGRQPVNQEILRRVLDRYDTLAPLQRDLMVEWLETPDTGAQSTGEPTLRSDVLGLRTEVSLIGEWRERMRGRTLTPEVRDSLVRDLAALAPLVPEEGWGRGKVRGRDILAMKRGAAAKGHAFLLLAFEFNETRLVPFLNTLFAGITTNSGIRVVCSTGEPAGPVTERRGLESSLSAPRLASRRLSAPLDALSLTAYPSDPRAFSLNARLQSSF